LIERNYSYHPGVFGILLSILYPEGEDMVMEEPEFSVAEANTCPNTLWKLMTRTHAHRMYDKSKEEAKHEAFYRYTTVNKAMRAISSIESVLTWPMIILLS
jgi:hypothetical protein